MQKFIARFFVTFFLLALLLPIIPASAYDVTVDQKNTTISTASLTIYNYGHNQTFTPTYDVLTKLQVYLEDRSAGGNIILTVKDDTAGKTVLTRNQRMDDGDGWEVFDFTGGDSLGFILTPGNQHSIWLETSYYSSDPVPKWVRSSHDAYSGGTRRQNSTVYSDDDFAFATFGYALEEEGSDEGSQPEPDNADITDLPDSNDTSTQSDSQDGDSTTESDPTEKILPTEEVELNSAISDLKEALEDTFSIEEDKPKNKQTSTIIKIVLLTLLCLVVLGIALAVLYLVYKDEIEKYYNKNLKPLLGRFFRNNKKNDKNIA
jgi:hypothetical protein